MKYDYEVVVVGCGPAGITSAIYLKRANINVCIIEKSAPGGQLNKSSTIENYPGFTKITGPELAYNFYSQMRSILLVPQMLLLLIITFLIVSFQSFLIPILLL